MIFARNMFSSPRCLTLSAAQKPEKTPSFAGAGRHHGFGSLKSEPLLTKAGSNVKSTSTLNQPCTYWALFPHNQKVTSQLWSLGVLCLSLEVESSS